jgi:hypothetical protein
MRRLILAVVTLSCLAIAGVNIGYGISAAEILNYSHRSILPPDIHADSAYDVLKFPANQDAAELAGKSWHLVKFQGGDEITLTPDDKSRKYQHLSPVFKRQTVERIAQKLTGTLIAESLK